MFVAVTLASIWLAWNLNTVQHRKAVRERARLEQASKRPWTISFVVEPQGADPQRVAAREFIARFKEHSNRPTAPAELSRVRQWMGDEPATQIVLRDRSELDSITCLFPEASVYVLPESGPLFPSGLSAGGARP